MTINRSLPGRRPALLARAQIITLIRQFFLEGGYLEVETPLRIPAPAPESYIDAVPSDGWFLQTSPELCMKRMLAAGYDKVFQICRCWRGGERGSLHLPEFTMLEWYRSGTDYLGLMDDCEALVRSIVAGTGDGRIAHGERLVEILEPWERISVREAFRRHSAISMEQAMDDDRFDEEMVEAIEPMLGLERPVFIYDVSGAKGCARTIEKGRSVRCRTLRTIYWGVEIANAFSELTDAGEQRARFIEESEHRRSNGKTTYPLPEKFLHDLRSMPEAAGIALGVDRLIMVLLGKDTIDDVVAFTPEEL